MSAINLEASQITQSNLYQSRPAQAEAPAPTATETTTQSCAQALYGATQELWISMEVLGHMLMNKQTGPNLEIAYTLFANAVCNWVSTYNSFTNPNGQDGQPDEITTDIYNALTQLLPDGSSIYQLSQTVVSNPADWQQLQEGVSNATLNSLFKEVDEWVGGPDGTSGSVGFQPDITDSGEEGNLAEWIGWLDYYLNQPNTSSIYYYNVFCSIANLDTALQGETGPICACLNELFNAPFFQYDGKSYSLEDIAKVVQSHPSNYDYTPTQIQEGEAALNSCLSVLKMVVNIANGYIYMQSG